MIVLPGLSKALGFESESDLIIAAKEWKAANPSATEQMNREGGQMPSECRDAISIVRTMVDVEDADLDAAVRVFADTPVAGRRSARWWADVLRAEINAIHEDRRAADRDEKTHKRKLRSTKYDS
jgi:hypothetical protein